MRDEIGRREARDGVSDVLDARFRDAQGDGGRRAASWPVPSWRGLQLLLNLAGELVEHRREFLLRDMIGLVAAMATRVESLPRRSA